MLREKEYIISVIVPVYNTAQYLHQLMRCIRNQTLSAEQIQVVFVNDASTDQSGEICREYAAQYTQVRYVELAENHGVSYARNLGMESAEGRYITFLDSDDLWSLNAFEKAAAFLDRHYEEIDAVGANIEFFEQNSGKHYLWFAVPEDYIVDMYTDYHMIGSHCSAFVIKTDVARQYRFDEKQRCWEDTKYINQLLLRKKRFGWLSGVTYYYRVRKSADSATNFYGRDKGYYLDQLARFADGIFEASVRECGELIPMMQYLTAYALVFRFGERPEDVLEEDELKEYQGILYGILDRVEDKYIWECCNGDDLVKIEMIGCKHGVEAVHEQSAGESVTERVRTADGSATEHMGAADGRTTGHVGAAGGNVTERVRTADGSTTEHMGAAGGSVTEHMGAADGSTTERVGAADSRETQGQGGLPCQEPDGWREKMRAVRQQAALLSVRTEQLARTKDNYDVLKRWFRLKRQGKSLLPYFHEMQWTGIAVYGMSDLGILLCEELEGTEVTVRYGVDRRAGSLEAQIPIYSLEDELPEADVIIITAVHFYDQIVDELQGKADCPLISLEDVVDGADVCS